MQVFEDTIDEGCA